MGATERDTLNLRVESRADVFMQGPEIIAVFDVNGCVEFGNEPYMSLEDGAVTALVVSPPLLTKAAITRACRQAIESEKNRFCEMRKPNDGIAWYQCNFTLIHDPRGRPIGVRTICFEITERKQLEMKMQRDSQLLVEAQQATHLGIWEWRLNEPLVSWTTELFGIYGVDPTKYTPTYEGYLAKVHPDDRERVRKTIERTFTDQSSFSHDERIVRPDGSIRYIHTWGHVLFDDGGRLSGLLGVCQDVTDSVHAIEEIKNERWKFELLASISRTLASTLDYNAVLEQVARLAVPVLADWCSVFRLSEDGTAEAVATAHSDPDMVKVVLEYQKRFPPSPEEFYRAEAAIVSGKSTLMSIISDETLQAVAHSPEHLELLRKLQPRSRLVVPLAARGTILGAIALNYSFSNRHYTEKDLELIEEIGRRAALALDNARLYLEAQKACAPARALPAAQ